MKRRGLSKRTRFEVFKRDRFTCQYCGKRPPEVMLEADHVVPVKEGGEDGMENLTTACTACNGGKSAVPLGHVAPAVDEMEVLSSIQEMLERKLAMRQQIKTAQAQRDVEDEAVEVFLAWWGQDIGSADGIQLASLRRFVRELGMDELRDALDATVRLFDRKPHYGAYQLWRYFCGVCWTKIKQRPLE
jgi:HNH endonuclease